MQTKQDNSALSAKVALRQYFLDRYHQETPASVFDCCQGEGTMWKELKRKNNIAGYWGVDVRRKPGRLTIDSVSILRRGVAADYIDIDTYGLPWKHWHSLLPHADKPTTVIMTLGRIAGLGGQMDKLSIKALGIPARTPSTMASRLFDRSIFYHLTMAAQYDIIIIDAQEAHVEHTKNRGNTRYIGVRIEPKTISK